MKTKPSYKYWSIFRQSEYYGRYSEDLGFILTFPSGKVKRVKIYEPHFAKYSNKLKAFVCVGHEEIIIVSEGSTLFKTFTR